MIIKSYILGELQTNCYLVYDKKTNEAIIIDPADDANFIEEQILSLKLIPKYIIATHGHFDHLLAAWELQLAFNIPFLIHQKDLFLLKNMQKSGNKWLDRKIIEQIPENIKYIRDKEKIILNSQVVESQRNPANGGRNSQLLQVIHTPGHTPGSISLYSKTGNILFSGDTIFSEDFGRTDLSYSSKKDLSTSLKKIFSLPPQTKVYPGHGESFELQEHK